MSENGKNMTIRFPENLKLSLEKMSSEVGISQAKLVVLATQSLIANYEENDIKMFKELIKLNPKVLEYLVKFQEEFENKF